MAEEDEIEEEAAVDGPKKSERKRQRERQRRSDLSNAFDELSSLLSQIDPDDSESAPNRRRRRRSVTDASDGDADGCGMTRLDLIERTAAVLIKLQHENTELKQRLQVQQRSGGDDKEVLVIVPTLSPADPSSSSVINSAINEPSPYTSYNGYTHSTHPATVDYSQHQFPYDYYHHSRAPAHHPAAYATYQGQRNQSWSGHPVPTLHPSAATSGMPHSEQLPQVQYPHHIPHPDPRQLSYRGHPDSPQRSHPHQYDSNVDLSSDQRRGDF